METLATFRKIARHPYYWLGSAAFLAVGFVIDQFVTVDVPNRHDKFRGFVHGWMCGMCLMQGLADLRSNKPTP